MGNDNKKQEMNFSDPDFFGQEFDQKYQQHKDNVLQRTGGQPNPMNAMRSLQQIIQ